MWLLTQQNMKNKLLVHNSIMLQAYYINHTFVNLYNGLFRKLYTLEDMEDDATFYCNQINSFRKFSANFQYTEISFKSC